jgi:hypothetical protein
MFCLGRLRSASERCWVLALGGTGNNKIVRSSHELGDPSRYFCHLEFFSGLETKIAGVDNCIAESQIS